MAEAFGARPTSPQVACLEGVRQSGLVVLILGKDYGAKQSSGISAAHEEYREARQARSVIASVQERVDRDPDETELVKEVQGWTGGLFRAASRHRKTYGRISRANFSMDRDSHNPVRLMPALRTRAAPTPASPTSSRTLSPCCVACLGGLDRRCGHLPACTDGYFGDLLATSFKGAGREGAHH